MMYHACFTLIYRAFKVIGAQITDICNVSIIVYNSNNYYYCYH